MITVIINVYNGEKYIKKCIDSIINQTYKDLEILIINDGSTDNTLNICNSYNDSRIRIISEKNKGLSLSRNTGIDNAKGEYLYFVDSDDYIEKDTIEYLYDLCIKYNSKISCCRELDIHNYDFNFKNEKEKIDILSSKDYLIKILFNENRSGTIWNKLIKKDVFDNLRFEDRIINDVALVYKLPLKVDKIVYSNQIKYYYLIRSDSIMGKHSHLRAIDQYDASIDRYNNIDKVYPNMIENKIGMLLSIVILFNHNTPETDDYINKKECKKLFNKLFRLRMLKYKFKFKDKVKLLLFRINPKLCRIGTNAYHKK